MNEICVLQREVAFEASQVGNFPAGRLTSLCILPTFKLDSGTCGSDEVMKCLLLAGITIGQEPCIVVYVLTWKKSQQNDAKLSEAGTSGTEGTKKGGTTKKVLPAPPVLTTASTSSAGGLGPSSADNSNPSLFFTFGDDPLEEEMFIPPHSSLEASSDKFGKVTWGQPGNGFVLNEINQLN